MTRDADTTSSLLDATLAVGVLVVIATEGLSLVHGLDRAAVAAFWIAVAVIAPLAWWSPRGWRAAPRWRPRRGNGPVAIVLGVTALIAVIAPPNGWDAMAYHMSRVVYWIQNGSVAHFPTHNLRQVVFGPFAEFCILHLQLLWGGDRLANLVQWAAFAGCLCAVAELARRCGAGGEAARAAVLFAATLPVAILQATGTENDLVAALWTLIAVLAVEENLRTGTMVSALKAGAALGLLALTKGTGYVVGAPVVLGWAVLMLVRSRSRRRALGWLACAGVLALGLNAGHYARNAGVFGHPLGDRRFVEYHQSELRSARGLTSNLIRNAGLHLATPIAAVNEATLRAVEAVHALIGQDITDERTTFLRARFRVGFFLDEDRGGNLAHFVAVVLVLGALATRRVRLPPPALACVALAVAGFVLLSWLLKWQPVGARFQHASFFLMAVPCGIAAAQRLSARALRWVSALFLVASLPWLLANEARQVISPPAQRAQNIVLNSRADLYMANWQALDQVLQTAGLPARRWDMKASYLGAVEALERAGCREIGLIQSIDTWDYPLWALAWERGGSPRIRQLQVANATAALASGPAGEVCAVVRLESPLGLAVPEPGPGRAIYRVAPIGIVLIPDAARPSRGTSPPER